MSFNPEAKKNVVFDAPLKNWRGEWYFLQNRPLNLAQLTVIEWRKINDNDPNKAANYLLYILSIFKVDQSDDRVAHVKKLYEDPSFDLRQFEHLHAVFEQASRVALGLKGVFQVGFKHSELEYSDKYPPVHVNKTLARQLSRDLLILETAFSQRKRRNFPLAAGQKVDEHTIANDNSVSVEGHLLHMADLLAYDSLQPLKEERRFAAGSIKKSIIPENTVAITYMRERINIRLIPYYPIALIGIPTALSNEWYKPPLDFLVIPHEVGHYLHQDGIYEDKDYPYLSSTSNTLLRNQTMEPGKKYEMNNHYIRFQNDGNLCIHRSTDDSLVWCFNTIGITYMDVKRVIMQDDGNFAAYGENDRYIWSAIHADPDPNARLILTTEGRLQLYSDVRGLMWSSENPKTIEAELLDRFKRNLAIQDKTDWRVRWSEEIFADCYGVMVAGPIAILAIQEMLASRQFEDLDTEIGKGEHPIALLRPLILTNFLEQLQTILFNTPNFTDSVKNLNEHWQNYIANYSLAMSQGILAQKHAIKNVSPDKTGQEILEDIKLVTLEILNLFIDIFPRDNSIWNWEEKWSHDTNGNFNQDGQTVACMEALLNDYSNVLVENNYKRIINPPEVARPDLNLNGGRIIEHKDHEVRTPDPDRLIATPFTRDLSRVTVELSELKQGSRQKLLTEEWAKLLQVQGWIDEGGDDSHPKG